jgi:hypothetical protein
MTHKDKKSIILTIICIIIFILTIFLVENRKRELLKIYNKKDKNVFNKVK